ncbi:MAG: ABC transporter substrate-binding protein, partial [Caldilinea sp.]
MKRRLQNPTQALVADFQSGRISRRQFLQTLAMLSGGVALAACAPAAPAAPSAASSAGGITPQVMIYGGSQDIASIDPSDRTDYSINAVMRQMYDRLFRFEGGWPQPIEPGLAQEWSASEDTREWTFQITDQAKFHDGTPL